MQLMRSSRCLLALTLCCVESTSTQPDIAAGSEPAPSPANPGAMESGPMEMAPAPPSASTPNSELPPGATLAPPMGQGDPATQGSPPEQTPAADACALPTSFRWSSTGPIIAPTSDANHDLVAIKDPSVVYFDGRWHVYASSVGVGGVYGLVYLSFADWSEASSAPLYYMDQTPGFATYVAAPQVFFFAPQNRWYLVYQSGPPMYSTTDDLSKPETWTRPAPFYASEPAILGADGWLDYWVICDDTDCHLFFSNDHGRWYRSQTRLADFPSGFGDPEIVMEDAEAGRLFEASNVYKVSGTNRYLALIEAFDQSSNWRRYFRSWTAESLRGPWQPLQDSGGAPFAGPSNVAFEAPAWAGDISHGEMLRNGHDQTLTIDACDLRFLYQAYDPTFQSDDYNAIPWRLGLLTAANPEL